MDASEPLQLGEDKEGEVVEEFALDVEQLDLDLSYMEQEGAELGLARGLDGVDDDDDDDAFGEVEELTLPVVVERIVDGNRVHEIEVPVIKDDCLITPSMYRDDIRPTDSKEDYARQLVLAKDLSPSPMEFECCICISACGLTYGDEHQACYLPCGHVYGTSCIKTWFEKDVLKCPQCKIFCTFRDIAPIRKTNIRIPAVDQKTSTRRFHLSNNGFFQFNKFETARRNVALIKWFHARNQLDGVLWRMKDLMKRRAYFLVRMKESENKGDAWGRLADNCLQQAKAWKQIAEALRRRAKSYNRRVNAHLPRLEFFATCCENI